MSTPQYTPTVLPAGNDLKQLIEQRAAVKDGHHTEYEALLEVLEKDPGIAEYDAVQLAAHCAAYWVSLCDVLARQNPLMGQSKIGGA